MNNVSIQPDPAWKTRAKTVLRRLEVEDADLFARSNSLRQSIEGLSLTVISRQSRLQTLALSARQPDSAFGPGSQIARDQIAVEKANIEAEIQALNDEIESLKQRATALAAKTTLAAGIYQRAKKVFNTINGNESTITVGVA